VRGAEAQRVAHVGGQEPRFALDVEGAEGQRGAWMPISVKLLQQCDEQTGESQGHRGAQNKRE
jgi:hypothetical protein